MSWLDRWKRWLLGESMSALPYSCTGTTKHDLLIHPTYSTSALPHNLRRLRLAKGWCVATLAAESAVSGSAIHRLERQVYPVDCELTTALKLARALDTLRLIGREG